MLQKGFFLTDSYNRAPYWDGTVLVNLTGASAFEENTKFFPGRYRIEVAPGLPSTCFNYSKLPGPGTTNVTTKQVYMSYDEVFTDYFIVRAYCGDNAQGRGTPGQNPYSGPYKVNGLDGANINSSIHGEDVNHIFGAGGGCYYEHTTVSVPGGTQRTTLYRGGGGNCLGNGSTNYFNGNYNYAGGAGSCLHILPVGGVFETDFIRAYHAAPFDGGSAYGGGRDGAEKNPSSIVDSWWHTRGGNSPYGTGGNGVGANGTGVGAATWGFGAGAYFDGTQWNDHPGTVNALYDGVLAPNSMIKITYLGPLIPGQY